MVHTRVHIRTYLKGCSSVAPKLGLDVYVGVLVTCLCWAMTKVNCHGQSSLAWPVESTQNSVCFQCVRRLFYMPYSHVYIAGCDVRYVNVCDKSCTQDCVMNHSMSNFSTKL